MQEDTSTRAGNLAYTLKSQGRDIETMELKERLQKTIGLDYDRVACILNEWERDTSPRDDTVYYA